MKLNWFSPLPPQGTGIADFTAQLLPHLCAGAEVVLWTDQDHWDRGLERLASVRHYHPADPPLAELQSADLNVYHVGNSLYHASLWQVSQKQPGLMVLHDLHLAHFCAAELSLVERAPDRYIAGMRAAYGDTGAWAAQGVLDGRLSPDWLGQNFPCTELVVGHSLGVVVHSFKGWRAVQRARRWPVCRLHLPYPTRPRGRARKPRPGPPGPHQLIVFGHIDTNRCLDRVLEALGRLPWRDRFQLDVYGELVHRDRVVEDVERWGLQGPVRLHGRVAEGLLDAALEWADLAINLRYPTMGEASHSQLRIWEHALPSIVTRVGWYAGLPADTVAWVRPGHEVADLQEHLLAFLRNPGSFQHLGLRGWRYLERFHAPQRYVRELLAFARQLQRGSRAGAARAARTTAETVGTLLGEWGSGPAIEALRTTAEEALLGLMAEGGGAGRSSSPPAEAPVGTKRRAA
jgi:glycosyltransferase involved in cell wall biosynthesis